MLLAAAAAACSEAPLVAPTGTVIEILVAPGDLAADGDTAVVSVHLTEPGGRHVEDGTTVVLSATGGSLCATPAAYPWPVRETVTAPACATRVDTEWPAVVELTTRSGVATALLRSGPAPGALTLKARSGGITQEKPLTVQGVVAPEGATAVMTASPDTLAAGQSTTVRAFLMRKSGEPVADGTRVVFFPDSGTVSQAIVLTQGGFATTRFTKQAVGATTVRLVSGLLADTVVIHPR